MKLTKLEHSGMILDKSGAKLIIDPGSFTTPITDGAGAVAVVVTHEHDDHWVPEQLSRLAAGNTDLRVFTSPGAAEKILATEVAEQAHIIGVATGDEHEVGPFRLRFFGGVHAEIHRSIPLIDNIGVVVNDVFAYAGDSYDVPLRADGEPLAVDTLAVPAYGPWMRMADSMDYIERVRPNRIFAVHEMLLSKAGKTLSANRYRGVIEALGGEYLDLQPYDTAEVPE